jgi:hypothetical protein
MALCMKININYLFSQIWSYNVYLFISAIKLLTCLQVLQFILLLFVGVNCQLFVEIIAKIPKKISNFFWGVQIFIYGPSREPKIYKDVQFFFVLLYFQ